MLDGIPLLNLTPAALLGVCILLILTGRLIPRYFLTNAQKEADKWQKAYESEREARMISDRQTTELLEVAQTTKKLVESVFVAGAQIRQSGETNALVPKD